MDTVFTILRQSISHRLNRSHKRPSGTRFFDRLLTGQFHHGGSQIFFARSARELIANLPLSK